MDIIKWANAYLDKLKPSEMYNTMLYTAAVLTKVLEGTTNSRPILVGGFSVEIYTNQDYSTRDLDFISK